MKIILESSKKNSIHKGDIVLLDKDNDFTGLGKTLVNQNHMFYISDVKDDLLRVHVISSNMSHVFDKYPSNVPIKDWERSGLRKPSYINFNSNGYTSIDNIRKVVGRLTSRDFKNAYNGLRSRRFVNQKIESLDVN